MITIYDKNYKFNKVNAIVLGYLTRKYKRNIPINESCNKCNKRIEGVIHRCENININDNSIYLVMYKSNIEENKGLSSFCFDKITYVIKENNNILCNKCYNIPNNNNIKTKCSICLDFIEKEIYTDCNHSFCNKCLLKWIDTNNKSNSIFTAICPICRNKI